MTNSTYKVGIQLFSTCAILRLLGSFTFLFCAYGGQGTHHAMMPCTLAARRWTDGKYLWPGGSLLQFAHRLVFSFRSLHLWCSHAGPHQFCRLIGVDFGWAPLGSQWQCCRGSLRKLHANSMRAINVRVLCKLLRASSLCKKLTGRDESRAKTGTFLSTTEF